MDGLRALKNETLTTEMILRRMMGLGMTLPFHVLKWRSERNQMGQHWVGRDGFSGKGFSSSSSQTLQENAEQTKVLSCSSDFSPFSNYYYFLKLNYIYSTYFNQFDQAKLIKSTKNLSRKKGENKICTFIQSKMMWILECGWYVKRLNV